MVTKRKVNKKTKSKEKPCRNLQDFKWTPQKKRVALLLSLGTYTIEAAAAELNMNWRTIYLWKEYPAFVAEIADLVTKNENVTRAGLLKECIKGLKIKGELISEDRSTHLDYVKTIADIQGITKQKIEHSGKIDGDINVVIRSPEEIEQEILAKLALVRSKHSSE